MPDWHPDTETVYHGYHDACMSHEEEDTCMSYEEEDTCMSYEEEDTCLTQRRCIMATMIHRLSVIVMMLHRLGTRVDALIETNTSSYTKPECVY